MSRTGFLVVGALIFALAAAGVLVWTNVLVIPSTPPSTPQTAEQKLMARIAERAAGGGVAVTFAEKDIKRWQLPTGHRLERFSLHDGEAVFARLTSEGPVDNEKPSWAERGLSIPLPVEFNNMTRGRRVEIGIVARSSQSNPSKALLAVYATQEAGNSGWQALGLKPAFELLTFTYDVPAVEAYSNQPILVIHSDEEGMGKSVEILGAFVKLVK